MQSDYSSFSIAKGIWNHADVFWGFSFGHLRKNLGYKT